MAAVRSAIHLSPLCRFPKPPLLTSDEIASTLIGLVPQRPGWAGHAAAILHDLRPVGGVTASCWEAENLTKAIVALIEKAEARATFVSLTLSSAEAGKNAHGLAQIVYRESSETHTVWFTSKMAISLSQPGSERTFDPYQRFADAARSITFNRRFFDRLARSIDDSLHFNHEVSGDGSEYDAAEAEAARLKALGVNNRSRFLHVGVDTQVTWPRKEQLVHFGDYRLVLMPKTGENTQSVHIDLVANDLDDGAAFTVINRFLSILSWCDDQFAVAGWGWSGNPVPVPVAKRDLAFATASEWPFYRSLPSDDKALRALALYREGLNASEMTLTSYAVLSFFKVIELGYRESDRVKKWIGRSFPQIAENFSDHPRLLSFLQDCGTSTPEDYIYDACRLAVAHASRKSPTDADDASEIRRLGAAAFILQTLARAFITERYRISDTIITDDPLV